jgi:hypothetical protein
MSCQGATMLEIFRLSNQLTINKQCNLTLSFNKTHAWNAWQLCIITNHISMYVWINIIDLEIDWIEQRTLLASNTGFRRKHWKG